MHHYTTTMIVPNTQEEVWYWLSDADRLTSLNPLLESITLKTPPPIRVGTEITMHYNNVPDADCIIIQFDPNEALKNHTPLKIWGVPAGNHYHSFVLTPVEDGTQVEQFYQFEPNLFGRLFAGAIEGGWPTTAEYYNNGLKAALETAKPITA